MLPKMKKVNLSVQLVDAVTKLIEEKIWKPGDKLPNEIELASSFNVSRNIMREAMKILENFGILDSRAGVGTFISSDAIINVHNMMFFNELRNNASVEKILETRLIIEPELAYYACLRCSNEDVKKLATILNNVDKKHIRENLFHTDDFDFHMNIATMSGNDILSNLLNTLLDQLRGENYSQFNQYVKEEIKQRSNDDHQNILTAFYNRDPLLARKYMYDHLFTRISIINTSYYTDLESSQELERKRNSQK